MPLRCTLFAACAAAVCADLVVKGCRELNYCSGHGMCVSRGIGAPATSCACFDGYGGPSDIAEAPAPDCSKRVCARGEAWADLMVAKPTNASATLKTSRFVAECSGAGLCNEEGNCECFAGFRGRACERLACYGEADGNTCSQRGQCLSLKQLSKMTDALPLAESTFVYGPASSDTRFWDESRVYRCHCDSSWQVGLGAGETQDPEYYGPGCERRRCPSGDDPQTPQDETDCANATARGGFGVGRAGNRCHVECSQRGACDDQTGLCACFDGFTGHNCGTVVQRRAP